MTQSTNSKTESKSSQSATRNAANSTSKAGASGKSSAPTSSSTASSASSSTKTTQASSVYNDKQILQDTLMSQKHITDAYNTFAGECANERLRSTMLNILNDEHNIQATIFSSMQTNGWYKTEPATAQSIKKAKQKATSS